MCNYLCGGRFRNRSYSWPYGIDEQNRLFKSQAQPDYYSLYSYVGDTIYIASYGPLGALTDHGKISLTSDGSFSRGQMVGYETVDIGGHSTLLLITSRYEARYTSSGKISYSHFELVKRVDSTQALYDEWENKNYYTYTNELLTKQKVRVV